MTQRSTRGGDNRVRLRRDLLDVRWPVDRIAEEMQRRFGDGPLAAFRHALGLSQADVAARWDTICAPSGEASMTGTRISAYERYPAAGTKRPTTGVLAVFAEIYATTPRRLISPARYAQLPAQERLLVDRVEHAVPQGEGAELVVVQDTSRQQLGTRVPQQWGAEPNVRSVPVACGGDDSFDADALQHMSERALIMAAAHESSEHAGWAETTNVGEATLEQLDADILRIANEYVHVPPLPMVVEMLRIRRRVYRLLEGHQKPADSAQLYLLAGTLCGLMANASTDLGYHDAAAEQARAAWAYAEIIGHNGLRAWTRGMQALIEYWSERPRQAARLAHGAQRYADATTAKVRLFTIEARMWSRLGNLEETNRCVGAAADAREAVTADTLHDAVGGVFGFNDAKSHYYAGATYIHLGQADPALDTTRQAIELYTSGPADQRSYGAESLARIDSAMAYLLKGSLDGAIDALQPVLALPVDKRIAQLDERLTSVRHRIAYPAFRDAQEAHDLDERIEEFCTATAAQDCFRPTSHGNPKPGIERPVPLRCFGAARAFRESADRRARLRIVVSIAHRRRRDNGQMARELARAWRVARPGPIGSGPLRAVRESRPRAGQGELLVRVLACGVCRTDLHVAEGDLPVHRPGVVPGHEVVGEVVELGDGAADAAVGDRVGIAWLRDTCGHCRYCARGAENLCPRSAYTGWDADGGYADYATVPAGYAYPLPAGYSDAELAPLLCAGIIGWRALQRAELPPGGRLAVYGFGASAHLAAQAALAQGAVVHVATRSEAARELALSLGAASAGDLPVEPVDSAILFAPAGELVPAALAGLDRGGTLAVAGIHLTDIPALHYQEHLFLERQLRSVTANTRQDGRDFLRFAAEHRLQVVTSSYPFDRADRALADLAAGRIRGAAVLHP